MAAFDGVCSILWTRLACILSGRASLRGWWAAMRRFAARSSTATRGNRAHLVHRMGYSTAVSAVIPSCPRVNSKATTWPGFLVNLSQSIPLSIWYQLDGPGTDPANYEENFGTLTPSLEPKPAYNELQLLTSSLKGETFTSKLSTWITRATGSWSSHPPAATRPWRLGPRETAGTRYRVGLGNASTHLNPLLREPDSLARRRQPGRQGGRTGLGSIGGELSETGHRRLDSSRLQPRRCGGRPGPGPFGGQLPAQSGVGRRPGLRWIRRRSDPSRCRWPE